MPQVVCVLFEDAAWTVHPQLGKGVYPPYAHDAHMANKQKNASESSEDRLFPRASFRIHSSHDSGPVRKRYLCGPGHQGRSQEADRQHSSILLRHAFPRKRPRQGVGDTTLPPRVVLSTTINRTACHSETDKRHVWQTTSKDVAAQVKRVKEDKATQTATNMALLMHCSSVASTHIWGL